MEAKKYFLLLLAAFFLLSLACGELVVPIEPQGGESDQPGGIGASESVLEEPLETLAPLPGGDSGESTADGVEEQEPDPAAADGVVVNDIAWTLLDAVELGGALESGNETIEDLAADGRLVGVRFSITNHSDELHTFIGLTIVDNNEQRYNYDSSSLDFIVEEERCETVNLGQEATITCTAIYDVAVEATGLQAVFNDLSLIAGEEKLVDLGLD